jgi:hypothetical protein
MDYQKTLDKSQRKYYTILLTIFRLNTEESHQLKCTNQRITDKYLTRTCRMREMLMLAKHLVIKIKAFTLIL